MTERGEIEKKLQEKSKTISSGAYRGYGKLEEIFHKKHTGQYISGTILGANDGIITTFVVVAGAVGASLSPVVILVLGFANVLGDAVSMGFGNYLGEKSEADYNRGQREKEYWETERFPEVERWEVEEIFKRWGFTGKDLDRAVQIVTSDRDVWVDIMMKEELGISEDSDGQQPIKKGLVTFTAFVLAGSVPLVPFLIPGVPNPALVATFTAGLELFIIGALRTMTSPISWLKGGLEMLLVGSVAGGIAYGVGYLVDRIVSGLI